MATKASTSSPIRLDRVKIVSVGQKARSSEPERREAPPAAATPTTGKKKTATTKGAAHPRARLTIPCEQAMLKRLNVQPQPATAGLGVAPAKAEPRTTPATVVAMTGTRAPKITATPSKQKKKNARRASRKHQARAFVVADVPMLDSPEWSSEDEIDNPKFNREFRRKHNEQLRRLLKENEALARKEAATTATTTTTTSVDKADTAKVNTAPARTRAAPSPAVAQPAPGLRDGVVARDSMYVQRANKAPKKLKTDQETVVRPSFPLSRCPSLLSVDDAVENLANNTSSSVGSFTYGDGDSSGSSDSRLDSPQSADDAFFYGDYGMTYSFTSTPRQLGSPASITLEDPFGTSHSLGGVSPMTPGGMEPADNEMSAPARAHTASASAGASANTSLHATFAPSTVSPSTCARPAGSSLRPPSVTQVPSGGNSPMQIVLADDMLCLPSLSARLRGGRTSTGGAGAGGARGVLTTAAGQERNGQRHPDSMRMIVSPNARAEANASTATQPPSSILSHGLSERRSTDGPPGLPRFSAIGANVSQRRERDVDSKRSSAQYGHDATASLFLLSPSTGGDGDEYELGLDDGEGSSIGHHASDLDAFLFPIHTTTSDPFGSLTRHGVLAAPLKRGPSTRSRPSGLDPSAASAQLDSPIPEGSFVLAGTLGRHGKLAASRPAGTEEEEAEYWEVRSASNVSEGPRSLLAKSSSLRRRESRTVLQSSRKNAHYFGSINPSSYHTARLASVRKSSQMLKANKHEGMLRMYSIVRGARRTSNTATVAITEPVVGLAAESRPYSATLAKPVQHNSNNNSNSNIVTTSSSSNPNSHNNTLHSSLGESQMMVYSLLSDSSVASDPPPPLAPRSGRTAAHSAQSGVHVASTKPTSTTTTTTPLGASHADQSTARTVSPAGLAFMHNAPVYTVPTSDGPSALLSRRASAITEREANAANTEFFGRRYSVPDSAPSHQAANPAYALEDSRKQGRFDFFMGGSEAWSV